LKQGIVLFAHGSRDPDWARPFERLAALLSKNTDLEVRLAYLELMQPSLDTALSELASMKVASIRVVPVFLGFGGHVKRDLPELIAAANPGVKVTIDPPVGEQAAVIEAIAAAIAKS
jgi:sirohydrochlorin cobaltochelatase